MESDNGPAFVAELLQLVCKAVNVKWKLHTMYSSDTDLRGTYLLSILIINEFQEPEVANR